MVENQKISVLVCILLICFISLIVGSVGVLTKNTTVKNSSEKLTKIISSTDRIALIKLDGIIDSSSKSDFFSDDNTSENFLKSLRKARYDYSVKGIILKINTPGGTVPASQNIHNEIIRTRNIKPVIVLMDDVAASGGYYIASAADRIIAQKGTLTGSIGVIFQTMDIHKLLNEKLSISSNTIKSGKYKDIGSPSRKMFKDERKLLQDIVDSTYKQFIDAIENGRIGRLDNYSVEKVQLSKLNLEKYSDGRIFTGEQAYQLGFIDCIGDIEDAHKMIVKMSNEKFNKNYKFLPLEEYRVSVSFKNFLLNVPENLFSKETLIQEIMPLSVKYAKRPLYLWE